VARVIGGDDGGSNTVHVRQELKELHNLYNVLLDKRKERGALDFDSTELQFTFDEQGAVTAITPRVRNTAHKVIEECMLCANVCAARFIAKHGKPGLYRVHEGPDAEKLEYLREFLGRFGIDMKGGEVPSTLDFQGVIDQLRGQVNGHVLQMALLRTMKQAVYQPENKGHFGLNYTEYAHFTSPIRRYPDLLVHRLIKSVIHSRARTNTVVRVGKPLKREFYPYNTEEVLAFGEHCSFAERRADSAVYDVLEWIKCDYISERVGDVHDGVITGVTKFGFFVELTDVFVEGLVHVSTLAGDYYQYDQGSQSLVGERSKRVYGMGDAVAVQIARVDVDERKVDFELVSHSPLKSRRRAKPERGAKASGKRKPSSRKAVTQGSKKDGGRKRRR
jgi:ribonuclease R